MLTVKEINEVSFGKASFSGYKAEDVDNFIDEVVESFTQLQAERDDALQQNAQLSDQLNEVNGQINELKAKNAGLNPTGRKRMASRRRSSAPNALQKSLSRRPRARRRSWWRTRKRAPSVS